MHRTRLLKELVFVRTARVLDQRRLAAERFFAARCRALVWPSARVYAPVSRKGTGIAKRLGAHLTAVRALAGMDIRMHSQCAALDEALTAPRKCACKWTFLRVDARMAHKVRLAGKTLEAPTVPALVRLYVVHNVVMEYL